MRHIILVILPLVLFFGCANKPEYKIPEPGLHESLSGHMLHQAKYAELCKQGHHFTCEISKPDWRQTPSLSILQGLTWLTGAHVNVVGIKTDKRSYWVATQTKDAVSLTPIKFKTTKIASSDWVIESLEVPLEGDVHDLIVVGTDGILDLRRIEGRRLNGKRFRFAFTSCMDDSFNRDQDSVWRSLAQDDPDYLFLLGDNVYATKALSPTEKALDPTRLALQYLATRRRLELYRLPKLIPTLAIWDDHDYGMKDGDKHYPYRRASREVFHQFFAQPDHPPYFQRGPENTGLFTAFKTQMFLLDDRSQRQKNGTDPGEYAHWGKAQEDWLLTNLTKFPGISWLLNGDQIFGGYHEFESFEGNHPASFQKFLAKWKDSKKGLIFVSGDRHLTELMEIKDPDSLYRTYEITASPAHAKTYPSRWTEKPNPRQIAGADLTLNYVLVDGQVTDTDQKLRITAKDKDGGSLYSKTAHVDWPKAD